jgi:hypothetical protein
MKTSETFAAFGAIALLGCFGYQALGYLQNGAWSAISLVDFALYMFPSNNWLQWPSSWIGLHRILDMINAGIGIGAVLILYGFAAE